MIGIQLHENEGAVAIWTEDGAKLVGTAGDIRSLVTLANNHTGTPCTGAAIAVPAWYNDVQREEIATQARAAGIARPRLVNEPSAAAMAFAIAQAHMPARCLVLSLQRGGVFDATILSYDQHAFTVLAADGATGLTDEVIVNPERLFKTIESPIRRAIDQAGISAGALDTILLAGHVAPLRSLSPRIEAAFGHAPVEPPFPETAVACGAAAYSSIFDKVNDVPPSLGSPPAKSGCLLVFALIAASASLLVFMWNGS